jgi:YD repeat-containing protein
MTSETRTLGTGAYLTQYGYDAAGRLSSMTYPSGRQLAYGFDAAGRIAGITTTPPGGSAQTVVANVAYHPFGGVKSFTYGNGQTYTRAIDLDGRIAGYTLGTQSLSVGFDAASRITSLAQSGGSSNSYGYDLLDRLTSAVMPTVSQSFGYDAVGNRTAKTVGAASATYAYPAASNRLSSITSGSTRTYVHDPNGAIVNDGLNGFTYDVRGRLIQAATALGTVTYGLNSMGQRYAKTVQGVSTLFHYDAAGQLIAETDPAGALKREYLYLGDIPVGVIQ